MPSFSCSHSKTKILVIRITLSFNLKTFFCNILIIACKASQNDNRNLKTFRKCNRNISKNKAKHTHTQLHIPS